MSAAGPDPPGPVSELSVEAWDQVLAVNPARRLLAERLAVPDMVEAGQGTIVNVSSVAGKRGWANASAHAKFALTGFTQALGAEVSPHGVRACVVYPGAMATHWRAWSAGGATRGVPESSPREALPPETVTGFIAWLATAPPELVLGRGDRHPAGRTGISVAPAVRSARPTASTSDGGEMTTHPVVEPHSVSGSRGSGLGTRRARSPTCSRCGLEDGQSTYDELIDFIDRPMRMPTAPRIRPVPGSPAGPSAHLDVNRALDTAVLPDSGSRQQVHP